MNPKQSRYYTYIRPVMQNKFAKTYSPLIFSLITIAIFSFYAIKPTVTTILSLQKSIDEQTSVLNRLQEKVGNLATGKQNYENIDSSIKNKISGLVPDNPALPQLINSLTYVSEKSEATISGLQFQTIEIEKKNNILNKDAPATPIDFTLNAQGNFASLMNMLTELKKVDRLIAIKSVNFVQPADSSLVMSITAQAFFMKN